MVTHSPNEKFMASQNKKNAHEVFIYIFYFLKHSMKAERNVDTKIPIFNLFSVFD